MRSATNEDLPHHLLGIEPIKLAQQIIDNKRKEMDIFLSLGKIKISNFKTGVFYINPSSKKSFMFLLKELPFVNSCWHYGYFKKVPLKSNVISSQLDLQLGLRKKQKYSNNFFVIVFFFIVINSSIFNG